MINRFQIKDLRILLFLLPLLVSLGCGGAVEVTQEAEQEIVIYNLESSPSMTGWFTPTPTSYNTSQYSMTDLQQPGSRIIYISADTGSDPVSPADPNGQIYFWDGTQIVDATGSSTGEGDVAYGTDPMNPIGPIKPYKRWSYVAPRRSGWGTTPTQVGYPWDEGFSYRAPGQGGSSTRYEFPDWFLFKRGETFDMHADYLSFARESNPDVTAEEIVGGSLAVSGGKSAAQMKIVGAYGDLANPRPRFINSIAGSFIRHTGIVKHVAYLSLHLDGRGTSDNDEGGFSFLYQTDESVNILFEDLWLEALSGSSIQAFSGQITLHRLLITDGFNSIASGSHVQGLYTAGNRDARIRIEESILMRNGFKHGDPALAWPPSGEQKWNIYDRNMYLSGECDNLECGVFDTISMIGASGDQFRPGMRVERNFFYQGYLAMGAHGGYAHSDGPTGTFFDNVLQRFRGTGTDDNRGHPGWGLGLTSGSNMVEVTRNIITGTQHEADHYALHLSALGWYCYSHEFQYATRNNFIHDNIFDTSSADEAVIVTDGEGNECDSPWVGPGVRDNKITNNIMINSNDSEWNYEPRPAAAGTTTDTLLENNTIYASRDAAAAALGWTGQNRTLKTYMVSLGHTVTSDDGFMEFFNEAKKQRRGYWRDAYTARSLVNYMKEGFGMAPLE